MKRSEPEPSIPSAPPNLKPLIEALVTRRDLTREEAESGMRGIIAGVDPCQTSAFLLLLRAKGETPSEVAGMVSVMREHMVTVDPGGSCVDIVGTGGDGHHTVNFSTAASIVAAACGACVAKHGNRSVSSQCGSADVLEELGVVIARACAAASNCRTPKAHIQSHAPSPDVSHRTYLPSLHRPVCRASRGHRAQPRASQDRLHVRAGLPPRDEERRPRAQGARRAHRLQHPRSAAKPGRVQARADWRVQRGDGEPDGPHAL